MTRLLLLRTLLFVALLAGCETPQTTTKPKPGGEAKAFGKNAEAEAKAASAESPAASTARPVTPPPVQRAKPGRPIVPAPDDVAAAPADAVRSESGVSSKVLAPATGKQRARVFDEVIVRYVIWTRDGTMVDRSRERFPDQSLAFKLQPAGLADVVTQMRVGEKRRAWIPASLGFKAGARFPEGDLTAELTLEGVQRKSEPPPTPPDVAAVPANASVTSSGLASRVLKPGEGKTQPTRGDRVEVHYTAWTHDGRMFDTSVVRDAPSSFVVGSVIQGWGEGLQLMVEGETRRLWIPQELAYGGKPGAPSGMLVFDVTLAKIDRPAEAPEAPDDVAAPPPSAKRTRSGLATRVLKRGKGKRHPRPTSYVVAHYTGWTPDGTAFASSVPRAHPVTFALDEVVEGWSEGLQLMVEGEKRRLWIPEKLAYGSRGDGPAGMLVFDVELIRIVK